MYEQPLTMQNKICVDAVYFVSTEPLLIELHNVIFFLLTLFFFCGGVGANGELRRKGPMRCLAASKDLCDFTCYFQCDFDVRDYADILSFGR